MPKRTLSLSSSSGDLDLPQDDSDEESIGAHVPKFSRLTASPSPSPSMHDPSPVTRPVLDKHGKPIQCLLPPHPPLTFESIASFEAHLYTHHTNRCVDCRANFPSTHLLNLHQAEQHDPLVAARREKGDKTFACLVPACEKVCANKWKRRMHVVDKHGFRKDYDWAVVERGIDGKGSVLKKSNAVAPTRSRKMSLTGGVGDKGVKRTSGFQRPAPIQDEKPSSSGSIGNVDEVGGSLDTNQQNTPGVADRGLAETASPLRRSLVDDGGVDDLAKNMSALRFVPPSVSRRKMVPVVLRLPPLAAATASTP